MKKISIIVPVYNVEKYLRKCLDSIVNQTYKNFELIIIDDGSTDNSANICDEYISNDTIIVHIQNSGVSYARNLGIKKCTGEYIMFLDSDDYFYSDKCLEILNEHLEEDLDVLLYKSKYYYEHISKYITLPNYPIIDSYDISQALKQLISTNKLSVSPCDKIIKSSIIKQNKNFFDEEMKNLEDIDWSLRIYDKISNIKTINEDIYVYRQQRNGSASSNKNSLNAIENMKIFIEKWANMNEYLNNLSEKIIYNYISYQYVILITIFKRDNLYDLEIDFIKKYKFLLKYNWCKKVKLTYIVSKIFGLKITTDILNIYLKKKDNGSIKI